MCGFMAQLVAHRTGIAEVAGSNPLKPSVIVFKPLFSCILGDPGAVSGGGKKSKRARKKIRAKKSQEHEEEPLGTRF